MFTLTARSCPILAHGGTVIAAKTLRPQQRSGPWRALSARHHASSERSPHGSGPPDPRARFDYLDSLRALAALTVVVLHAVQQYGLGLDDWGVASVRGWLGAGAVDAGIVLAYERLVRWAFFAVQVFIIISGFSLMITVARSPDGRLGGGLRDFFARRARRILPPYYAALALRWW